jgi:hypothetical protein
MRARHYDPATGRFLQTDPLGIEADHLYAYARNNPLAFADPTGMDAWSLQGQRMTDGLLDAYFDEIETRAYGEYTGYANRSLEGLPMYAEADINGLCGAGIEAACGGIGGYGAGVPRVGPGGGRGGRASRVAPGRVAPASATNAHTGTRYVYDASAARYRDVESGRFVSQSALPWPANGGFASRTRGVLQPGTVVDRFGRPSGRYASTPGASISERGLPAGSEMLEYHRYVVARPLPADMGPAAKVPEFGANGGATQYLFDHPILELIRKGYLVEAP